MKRTKAGSAMRCDADRLPGRKRVTFDIEEPRIVAIESFKHQALWMSPYSNLVKHGIPCRVSVTHDTGDVAAANSAHRVAMPWTCLPNVVGVGRISIVRLRTERGSTGPVVV